MNRGYSPIVGRFHSADLYKSSKSMIDPQRWNRYGYTRNDPVNATDRVGLDLDYVDCEVYVDGGPDEESPYEVDTECELVLHSDGGKGSHNFGDDPGGETQEVYDAARQQCDRQLAGMFGGQGAVAAGNGFEPAGMPGYSGNFRDHLVGSMHLYGSSDGHGVTNVYIPPGFTYLGRNPGGLDQDSHMFHYRRLGSLRNVTLIVTHLADFRIDSTDTNASGSIRVGTIGGAEGRAIYDPNNPNQGPYVHSHLAIMRGRGNTGNRVAFAQGFCQ